LVLTCKWGKKVGRRPRRQARQEFSRTFIPPVPLRPLPSHRIQLSLPFTEVLNQSVYPLFSLASRPSLALFRRLVPRRLPLDMAKTGLIVGCVVGGVVLVAALVGLAICFFRRSSGNSIPDYFIEGLTSPRSSINH